MVSTETSTPSTGTLNISRHSMPSILKIGNNLA